MDGQQQHKPLLPLIRGVLFPNTVTAIPVGRERSTELVRTLRPGDEVLVGVQRTPQSNADTIEDLYAIATLARVQQIVRMTNGAFRVVLQGLSRHRLETIEQTHPFWKATSSEVEDENANSEQARALATELEGHITTLSKERGGSLQGALVQQDNPGALADVVAAELGLDTETRASLLETTDVEARLEAIIDILGKLVATSDVKTSIDDRVRKELGKNQREAILREQLKAIKKELGESPDDKADDLRTRLDEADLPDEVRETAEREFQRLDAMNPAQAEYGVIRNYLEWILDLPWREAAEENLDLDAIAQKLDADHHGLDDVKKRILEHMAVLEISGNIQGTILCLAGPPGVGKTSLAQSVADAIDRPLVRISLGGIRDEAEVRGHRRTYVGALPGRFINAMKKAGVNNPVVVLDEIDKLGQSWMGSPESALLEVLDPEQNSTFTDHYLEMPFDLSNVIFICTANELSKLSAPLRDRLEIITVSGYTPEEKVAIARDHLVPKRLESHGLTPERFAIDDGALRAMVLDYTREAGVRQLDREITKMMRAITLKVARSKEDALTVEVTEEDLVEYLGKPRFFNEIAARASMPGVATGLAWTPVGGDILFIETTRMPGKGRLETTGQLGDVMKESARAALAYVRTNATELGIDPNLLDEHDLHLHIPAGAIPKDGPSAGVTIFTALTSLLTDRRVRHDTAMTGECSLRGRVLPVGGIKAKLLAAHRAGIKRVILPERNAKDLDEVPESALADLEIILASDMSQVLEAALEPEDAPLTPLVEDPTGQTSTSIPQA